MRKEVISLTQKLIRINSQNPPGNEKRIAHFIKDYLKDLGLSCELYEFKKDRTNVLVRLTSKKKKKTILFTPHLDTVPVTGKWRYPPLGGVIVDGRIYGRGATDCKSNVAVSLAVIKKFKMKQISLDNLDVIFVFSSDEETGSKWGIKPLVKRLKGIDYGVVLDSDEFDIIVAQKGLLHLRIEVFGKEAHGAYPERGINAIENSICALNYLLKKKILSSKPHKLLKGNTINIGKFEGGNKVNIVAGYAYFDLDIRFIPPLTEEKIIGYLKKIFDKYLKKYKIKILSYQLPIEIDTNNFLIKILKKTLRKHNLAIHFRPSFGATVINFLKDRGIETFGFGFGSRGCAHTENEYVRIDYLVKGVEILKDYIITLDKYLEKHN